MTRFLNLFRRRRDRLERELDRELQYHLTRRIDDRIKLCQSVRHVSESRQNR